MSRHQFLQNTRAWKVASIALKFKELKTLLASLTPIPNTLILRIAPNSTFALTESPLVNKDVNWDWSTMKTANLVTLPRTCLNGKYYLDSKIVGSMVSVTKALFFISLQQRLLRLFGRRRWQKRFVKKVNPLVGSRTPYFLCYYISLIMLR